MDYLRNLLIAPIAAITMVIAGNASASLITTTASAAANGTTVSDSQSGATSAAATAAQTIPSPAGGMFASAAASGVPGSLHASGDGHSDGGGNVSGEARATWADRFSITSPIYATGASGFFTGFVSVSGSLVSEIFGRAYADSEVFADVRLESLVNPLTGGTAVLASHGEARHLIGYDIGERTTGSDTFILDFVDMPFLFGLPIDVSLALLVHASLDTIDSAASGGASADYSHTMTWGGLTTVRDASGRLIADYRAISPSSGFDFAGPMTPGPGAVPEPESAVLLIVGLIGLGASRSITRGSANQKTDPCPVDAGNLV